MFTCIPGLNCFTHVHHLMSMGTPVMTICRVQRRNIQNFAHAIGWCRTRGVCIKHSACQQGMQLHSWAWSKRVKAEVEPTLQSSIQNQVHFTLCLVAVRGFGEGGQLPGVHI